MRVVGIDLGTRRIGVAVSDPGGVLATPHSVVERSGDPDADRSALAALIAELGAARVVVGLPLGLDGRMGPAAQAAAAEASALAEVVGVPVETHDERLTTVSANAHLRAASPGLKASRRRRVIDKVAAAVMLQSWLDARTS